MDKARAALSHILELAGLDPALGARVAMTGDDPVLPTPFLLGTAGAAVLGAVGVAATDLWRTRGGHDQGIDIDARRGALALRTVRYAGLETPWSATFPDDLSGFYPCVDGWVQLHCAFPHFHAGVLGELGCPDDPGAAPAVLAGLEAQAVEDRMGEAGLPVFKVRDRAAWRSHPQAAAVAGLPLMEIIKVGDSAPEPLPDAARPLTGVRVLDLTRVIAGPAAGRTLAEHGAHVLRISGPHLPAIESLVMDTGHGKRAAHVDLRSDDGTAALRGLVRDADVFSQNYRPGSLAARGFGPDTLHGMRPGIVCLSLSAWSHAGPWADRRGFDTLVQCATGLAHEQGGDAPDHLPASALDYLAGYLGAFGVMAALTRRAHEGGSYLVRVSLAQTAHWLDGLGRVDGPGDPRQLADPTAADVADLLTTSATAWGELTHLKPLLGLSETPPRWDRPVVPLGTDQPLWE